jgi:hypothetical protein
MKTITKNIHVSILKKATTRPKIAVASYAVFANPLPFNVFHTYYLILNIYKNEYVL